MRLLAVSDSTGTLWKSRGLEPRAVAGFKARGGSLARHHDGLAISTEDGLALVGADLVIDATPTDLARPEIAVRRCRSILDRGARLALAAKDALCFAGEDLLSDSHLPRVGLNAVLGGTGAHLAAELGDLRGHCTEVEIVGNASTTALIEEIEAGRSLDEGIASATRRGLLETDPTQDLDGSDAAVKLAIVARALWGFELSPADLPKMDLQALDPARLRERRARRSTTRLIGRARRDGSFHLAYEEIPRGSHLAVPSDRVVYAYKTGRGLRVHVGSGLGPEGTADALLADVLSLTCGLGRTLARRFETLLAGGVA
jgi:homoserine dehydrogenase